MNYCLNSTFRDYCVTRLWIMLFKGESEDERKFDVGAVAQRMFIESVQASKYHLRAYIYEAIDLNTSGKLHLGKTEWHNLFEFLSLCSTEACIFYIKGITLSQPKAKVASD